MLGASQDKFNMCIKASGHEYVGAQALSGVHPIRAPFEGLPPTTYLKIPRREYLRKYITEC